MQSANNSDNPVGHISKIFEYYYSKAKDESGNLPIIIKSKDQPKKNVILN